MDIDGLGQAGSLVVGDPLQQPKDGEWMLVDCERGVSCVRWEPGMPIGERVIYTIS
jgi:hypothetical protein